MNIKQSLQKRFSRTAAAFQLIEATVSMGLVGTVVAALMTGYTTGFFTMQMARENLRATQIMLEKVETIRLYSWKNVNTPNFIPVAFTNYYDPHGTLGNQGVAYRGEMTITPCDAADVSSSYRNHMRKVTVTLRWTTGHLERTRQFTSYISRYGLQDYIF